MPRLPALPENQRFFARIDRFTLECPRCGQISQAHFDRAVSMVRRQQANQHRPDSTRHTGNKGGKRLIYNPLTSRFQCPACGRVFGVGLLLYPVAHRVASRQPVDTRPTYQQLMDIRRLSGGFLVDKALRGEESVNIFVELPCLCPDRGSSRICPVHGWDWEKVELSPLPEPEPDPQDPDYSRAYDPDLPDIPPVGGKEGS